MSRVINPESAGKERNRAVKVLVLSIRELLKQQEASDLSRDLLACILMSLDQITETVDVSMEAWEKRGYWVKAEHFRMEWRWAEVIANRIRADVLAENYAAVIPTLVEVMQAHSDVKISENHRMGTPWTGCWAELKK